MDPRVATAQSGSADSSDTHPVEEQSVEPSTVPTADLGFAQQVRDRRRQEGFSQAALAERAGISRNYLSQIERGKATNLSWQVRQTLVDLLGIAANSQGSGQTTAPLPEGLEAFAAKAQLPKDDVLMLAGLKYRGKQPTTPDKWELLYNVIKMTVDN